MIKYHDQGRSWTQNLREEGGGAFALSMPDISNCSDNNNNFAVNLIKNDSKQFNPGIHQETKRYITCVCSVADSVSAFFGLIALCLSCDIEFTTWFEVPNKEYNRESEVNHYTLNS